jgi:uncharacterized protein YuzE
VFTRGACWALLRGPSTLPLDASMQHSFANLLPELASDLASELRATGRAELAVELESATVRAVTFDPDSDAGSIALEPSRELNVVERDVIGEKVGGAVPLSGSHNAYLEMDNFGRLIGVEVVTPSPELRSALQWLASNNRWSGP